MQLAPLAFAPLLSLCLPGSATSSTPMDCNVQCEVSLGESFAGELTLVLDFPGVPQGSGPCLVTAYFEYDGTQVESPLVGTYPDLVLPFAEPGGVQSGSMGLASPPDEVVTAGLRLAPDGPALATWTLQAP
ncbi:MAG TPA: hypothetical protein VJP77_08935 [Planctomycetota bacterium]|nr:hypothetical protein [Planctomycetota bacterium]